MKNYTETQLNKEFNKRLNEISDTPKNWSEATDEVRDMTHSVRQAYNELHMDLLEGEDGYVDSLNFRALNTPTKWNTIPKKQMRRLWKEMKGNTWAKLYALGLDD